MRASFSEAGLRLRLGVFRRCVRLRVDRFEFLFLRSRLDINLVTGQAGGETGVLPFFTDGKRQLIVRNNHAAGLRAAGQKRHGFNICRGKRRRDELRRVVRPDDDVHLFAVQFVHNRADPRAARADAGADRVNAVLRGIDGQLRAGAGLAGDGLDLDKTGCNLGDFEFKEPLNKARMRPGDNDLWASCRTANLHDVDTDEVALVIIFRADLFGRRRAWRRSCRCRRRCG